MTGLQGMNGGKNVKEASNKGEGGDEIVQKKSLVFGRYSNEQLVIQVKALALDPCSPENSRCNVRPLWNQIIRVRKAMALADHQFPRRKRQLQQFVERLNTASISKLGLPSIPNHTKLRRGGLVAHASSKSCLLNSVLTAESINQGILLESHSSNSLLTFDSNCLMKQISSESLFVDEVTKWTSLGKDLSYIVDSDESANYSNLLCPENSIMPELPSLNLDETSLSTSSIFLDKRNQKPLQPVRQLIRSLNFIGDSVQKMAVPVGPRFQVDVPDWIGPCHFEYSDYEVLRWLGTQIWPLKASTPKFNARAVGKGRAEICSCDDPLSSECIRQHVQEERLHLQYELGTVFFSWKFDEMGEQVSHSWTLQEQHKFMSMARMKQTFSGKFFMRNALKCFPRKCPKTIMNYYFNVYIPRQMNMQKRLSLKEVDSDGDEVEDCSISDMQNHVDGGIASLIGKSKKVKYVKSQYLRKPS